MDEDDLKMVSIPGPRICKPRHPELVKQVMKAYRNHMAVMVDVSKYKEEGKTLHDIRRTLHDYIRRAVLSEGKRGVNVRSQALKENPNFVTFWLVARRPSRAGRKPGSEEEVFS